MLASMGRVLLLFTLIVACSEDEGKAPEDEYAGRYAEAKCEVLEPCCKANGLSFKRDTCVVGGAGFVQTGVDRAKAVGATYDARAADECIARTRELTRSCSADDASSVCSRVFRGTKAAGATCTSDVECAPDGTNRGHCRGASLDGSKQGTCVVLTSPAKVGDVCAGDAARLADCARSELQCDLATSLCKELTPIGGNCPGFTIFSSGLGALGVRGDRPLSREGRRDAGTYGRDERRCRCTAPPRGWRAAARQARPR
jgi:hypothetical protein